MARTRHYSDFLTSLCSLVGIPSSRLSTELEGTFRTLFNTAYQDIWQNGNWIDICPFGEARFAGNKLTYPNDLTKTAYWTATAVTATANSIGNPLDGKTTASKLMETAATSAHNIVQAFTVYPDTQYTVSVYLRDNGRNDAYLLLNDGVTAFSAFFDLATGTVGTTANCDSTSIVLQSNGFYRCTMTFTSTLLASASKSIQLSISSDGATLSYAGDITKGFYVYGFLVQQTSNCTVQDSLIAWEQTGEEIIDALFDVYPTNPMATRYPSSVGYELTPDGIQLINGTAYSYTVNGVNQGNLYTTSPANPVFLSYRKSSPTFSGTTYSATATYAVDQQIYFTNSLGNGNFYKCAVATTAGQSPDTTAASWTIIPIYDVFFQYCVYQAYGDWLISDGQMDKAAGAYAIATRKKEDSFDAMERQMGHVQPMKVSTHLTSRVR